MAGRSRTAIAAIVFALSTLIATGGATALGATAARPAAGTELFGTILHNRNGTSRVVAPIKGLSVPSRSTASFFRSVDSVKNRYLYKADLPTGRREGRVAPRDGQVAISGTYDVVGMPRKPVEYEIVVACQGATSFGFFCGTATHPAWEANTQPKGNSVSEGTYSFGRIPVSASGWKIGIILFDGVSNAGYYPSSGGVLVAAKGSKKSVSKAVSMKFVTPEIKTTFRVAGSPKGYQFEFDAIICPSSVTADQLGLFEDWGDCGIAEGAGIQQVGIYARPGKWTVRYIFQPLVQNVEMFASDDVIAKNFSVTGPTVELHTLAGRVVTHLAGTYIKPSVSSSVNGQLLGSDFEAAVAFVDVATNTEVAAVYTDPFSSSTDFYIYLDAGSYAAYSEVVTPFPEDPYAQLFVTQVVLQQLGGDFSVGSSAPTFTAKYTIKPVEPTIIGHVSIPGLYDLADASGWDNVQPYTFIQACPGATFSLECTGAILASTIKLLGGGFAIYGITGKVSLAFVYTDLADHVIVGPAVTTIASPTRRHVGLTAPYKAPTFWGNVTVSDDNDFELWDLWIQACPAAKAFSVSCAGAVSQSVNSFDTVFPPAAGSFHVGFGIDLPAGDWRIGAVGATFDTGAAQQLGPSLLVDVATTYPLVSLTAKG
jgi:hypothetical protein